MPRMVVITPRQRSARSGKTRQSCLSWHLNGTNSKNARSTRLHEVYLVRYRLPACQRTALVDTFGTYTRYERYYIECKVNYRKQRAPFCVWQMHTSYCRKQSFL